MNETKIKGFKAFNPDWTCKDCKFEVGKTFEHKGKVEICTSGFHFCQNPLDLFGYYPPTGKFAEVEGDGDIQTHTEDSKVACRSLEIKAEINLHTMIGFGVKFILDKINWKDAKGFNTGHQSAATNTGYQSAATNTGDRSAATNTGEEGVAISLGIDGKASGAIGCWLTLAEWKIKDGKWHRIDVKTAKVDGKKIKADTFYMLKGGKFVEAK